MDWHVVADLMRSLGALLLGTAALVRAITPPRSQDRDDPAKPRSAPPRRV